MKLIEVNSEAWVSLLDEISKSYSDGELISHDWLKQMFGLGKIELSDYENIEEFLKALQMQQFAYMQLIETLRWQILKEHKLCIRNIPGSGYIVIKPEDQTQYAYDEFMKTIRKAIRETDLIMNNVRPFFSDQKYKDNDLKARCSMLKQMLGNLKR
ncbi:MAG: hypothetical protein ACI4TD_04070 [Phocaeicola sp.]